MHEPHVEVQTLNLSEARKHFSGLVNQVARKETRVLVETSGAPVAAVVSADDLRRLQRLDAQRERGFEVLDRMRTAFQDVPVEETEDEVTKALDAVRAQQRATR